jgi:uncharacterized membrane protein
MLGGLASMQALFIGLLILMYAQHESHIAEGREEVDLQVALHSERETSKVLRMLTELHNSLVIRSNEHDLGGGPNSLFDRGPLEGCASEALE